MTYQIDRSLYLENGPAITADAAIQRVRRAALRTVLGKCDAAPLKKAA